MKFINYYIYIYILEKYFFQYRLRPLKKLIIIGALYLNKLQ